MPFLHSDELSMPAEDYVKWLRSRVGKDVLIVNYSGGWIENNEGEVLLQNRSPDQERWGFPGGAMNIGETAQDT
ncbi:MAG: NUDIX domain-containing protein, partial [Bacteroidota bacterium]